MQIHGRFDDLRYKEIGGGFGYTLTPLDDVRVVSYMVMDESHGEGGIQPGSEILALDGKPIKDAALAVSVLWTRNLCLPQPSAALNNATNRFKQQMSITLFSKVL